MPLTIDQLFHRFLVNEKRKEYLQKFDSSRKQLTQNKIGHLTFQEMESVTKDLVVSYKNLVIADDKVKRFHNQQNRLFLRLLENQERQTKRKSTFFGSNLADCENILGEQ